VAHDAVFDLTEASLLADAEYLFHLGLEDAQVGEDLAFEFGHGWAPLGIVAG
jgi:hypothetical protein